MNKLKLFKTNHERLFQIVFTVVLAILLSAGIIKAATTIGNNITTGGTIIGSGTNNLYGATSIGGALTATSTLAVNGASTLTGALTVYGNSTLSNLTATGTLSVTGLTTLGNASTTLLSIGNTGYIGGNNGLILADGSITDASGSISFGNENLTTTGSLSASDITASSLTATSTFSGPVAINGNTRITDKNSSPPALISFTFDDAYATDRTLMYDVFNAAGVPATTYIVTDQIGQSSRLTSAQTLELASAGWEIGAHTMTHGISGNNDLTTGTESQIEAELVGSKNALTALGLTVTSAAYPQGRQNALVRKVTKNNFTVGRGVQGCDTADTNANRYPIETFNLMSCGTDSTSEADMKLMVDNAVSKRRWLTFYMHQTDASDVTKLANVISYIQSTYPTAKIVTITQGYNLLKNFVDYENAYGENYRIGVDGSMTFNNAIFSEGISEMVSVIGKQAIPVMHAYRASGTTGYNFFIGPNAGNFTMSGSGAEASTNLGVGNQVLQSLTTGKDNTAAGISAMLSNTTGANNSALGRSALYSNTTGVNSTAVGYWALYSNQTSGYHTAIGVNALKNHTTSDGSTAFGTNALQSDVSGYQNTAVGLNALQAKTTGNYNTAIGTNAGYSLTGAASNTFIGHSAGFSNLTGASNVFIGYQAGYSETGSNKLYIDNSNTTIPLIYGDFSNDRVGIASSSLWRTFGVEGTVAFNGLTTSNTGNAVCITTSKEITDAGAASCVPSALQFKKDISDITSEKAKDIMLNIEPVQFTRKDNNQKRFGFIADWSEKLDKRLIEYKNGAGEIWSFDYMGFTSVITKFVQDLHADFQKLIARVSGVEDRINNQQKEIDNLREEMRELKSSIGQ